MEHRMRVRELEVPGLLVIEPPIFEDARGAFFELFHAERYAVHGIPGPFVQDNVSWSVRGTLRGLHYQLRRPQGKLVTVLSGCAVDVAVDIRAGSPTFGKWVGLDLSDRNRWQLYIPPGFAHGFCVTSEQAVVAYKCTDFYAPQDERGILWNDPGIGIRWPVTEPLLSEKDRAYKPLADMAGELPQYQP